MTLGGARGAGQRSRRRARLRVLVTEERYAIRMITELAGATFALEYVHTDEAERRRRAAQRWLDAPHTTFEMTEADHDRFLAAIDPPSRAELDNRPIPSPPSGHDTWTAWASRRWPTLPEITGRLHDE